MELAVLKKRVQTHLSDGLVPVVGSGLSVEGGIPGMPALASHLLAAVTPRVVASSRTLWTTISADLSGEKDLESTLLAHPPDNHLETLIVEATGRASHTSSRCIRARVIAP